MSTDRLVFVGHRSPIGFGVLLFALCACSDPSIGFRRAVAEERCEEQRTLPVKVREGIAESLRIELDTNKIDRIERIEASGNVGVITTRVSRNISGWADLVVLGKALGSGTITITTIDNDDGTRLVSVPVQVVAPEVTLDIAEECRAPDAGVTVERDAAGAGDAGVSPNIPDASAPDAAPSK
jgi:hypothetical protein